MQINFVSTTRADISILLPLISAIDSKGYSYRALAFGLKHSETVSKEFIRLKLKGNVHKFTFNPKPQDTEQIISGMADLTRSLLDVELDEQLVEVAPNTAFDDVAGSFDCRISSGDGTTFDSALLISSAGSFEK